MQGRESQSRRDDSLTFCLLRTEPPLLCNNIRHPKDFLCCQPASSLKLLPMLSLNYAVLFLSR